MCAPSQLLMNLMPTENMKPPASQVHDFFVTGMLLLQTEVYARSHVISMAGGLQDF